MSAETSAAGISGAPSGGLGDSACSASARRRWTSAQLDGSAALPAGVDASGFSPIASRPAFSDSTEPASSLRRSSESGSVLPFFALISLSAALSSTRMPEACSARWPS